MIQSPHQHIVAVVECQSVLRDRVFLRVSVEGGERADVGPACGLDLRSRMRIRGHHPLQIRISPVVHSVAEVLIIVPLAELLYILQLISEIADDLADAVSSRAGHDLGPCLRQDDPLDADGSALACFAIRIVHDDPSRRPLGRGQGPPCDVRRHAVRRVVVLSVRAEAPILLFPREEDICRRSVVEYGMCCIHITEIFNMV